MMAKLIRRCLSTTIVPGLRGLYHPHHKETVYPETLPGIMCGKSGYVKMFEESEWGNELIRSFPLYDPDCMKIRRFVYASAKEVVIAYLRSPRAFRPYVVDSFIKNRFIVEGMDSSLFPSEWDLREDNMPPLSTFKSPIYACKELPFDPDILYIYVTASCYTPQFSSTTYKGLAYLMFRDHHLIDEGAAMGTVSTCHMAEVESINIGARAGIVYLSSLTEVERAKISAVCLRSDCQSGLGHNIGSSLTKEAKTDVKEILWSTYNSMDFYHTFHFQHVSRELNFVADYLASYACQYNLEKSELFDDGEYRFLCESMFDRVPRVGFAVKGERSIVA